MRKYYYKGDVFEEKLLKSYSHYLSIIFIFVFSK